MTRHLLVVALGAVLLAGCAAAGGQPTKVQRIPVPGDAEGKLPFADAVRAGGLVFQTGKLGIDPETQKLVPGGIEAETRQTMELIEESFARQNVGMDRVVKCTVFMVDMKEWPAMNAIYVQYFPGVKPARSAFGVTALALGARVEIECIAAL